MNAFTSTIFLLIKKNYFKLFEENKKIKIKIINTDLTMLKDYEITIYNLFKHFTDSDNIVDWDKMEKTIRRKYSEGIYFKNKHDLFNSQIKKNYNCKEYFNCPHRR